MKGYWSCCHFSVSAQKKKNYTQNGKKTYRVVNEVNEHWEKPIWVLAHACYFILFLPGKQSLHNFDQAAGSKVIIEGSMVEVLWLKTNPWWVHDTKYLLPTKVTYSYILFKYMYLWTDFQGVLQMVEQHSMTGQNVCMPSCCSAFDYGKVHQGSLSRSALFLVWSFHPNTFFRVWKLCGRWKVYSHQIQ